MITEQVGSVAWIQISALATEKWLYRRERLELSIVRKTKISHICFDVQGGAGYNQETVPSALSHSSVRPWLRYLCWSSSDIYKMLLPDYEALFEF